MVTVAFRTVTRLNRNLRTLFAATFLFRAGMMAYPFLSAYLLTHRHYQPAAISLILGAFGVGALAADLLASVLLGLVRARMVMIAWLVVHAAVLLVIPVLPGVAPLAIATVLWGFSYEMYTPAMYSQISHWAAPDERKLAFAGNRTAINLGMGIGPVIGGVVFAIWPDALFYINSCCALATAGYLAWRGRSSSPGAGASVSDTPRPRRRLVAPTVRGETQFWAIFGLALPVHLVYALPPALMSAYLIVSLRLPSYWVSVIFGLNALIVVLTEVPINHAMRQVPPRRALPLGYAAAGAGFVLTGLFRSPAVLMAATVCWTAGEIIVFPGLLSYITDLSDPAVRDRNVSFYSAGPSISLIVVPAAALALEHQNGARTPWLIGGFVVLAALVLLLAARASTRTWHTGSHFSPSPRPGTGPANVMRGRHSTEENAQSNKKS